MKFIVDTNVFVSSLSDRSKHHWIIEAWLDEKFDIAVSNEILLEYEEVLNRKYGAENTLAFLKALQDAPNVEFAKIFFQWRLLPDPDDDKFVDAYISSGADYIVSEDSDFKVLKNLEFPKVKVIRIVEFKEMLKTK